MYFGGGGGHDVDVEYGVAVVLGVVVLPEVHVFVG